MDTEYWSIVLCMLIVASTGLFVIGLMSVTVTGTLVEDVQSAPYAVTDYELDVFDCTDMSAIMEVHLTDIGYDSTIIAMTRQQGYGHAMVVVYNHTEKTCVYVECTAKHVVSMPMEGFDRIEEYDNIVDAVENSRWGAGEWGLMLYLREKGRF